MAASADAVLMRFSLSEIKSLCKFIFGNAGAQEVLFLLQLRQRGRYKRPKGKNFANGRPELTSSWLFTSCWSAKICVSRLSIDVVIFCLVLLFFLGQKQCSLTKLTHISLRPFGLPAAMGLSFREL